MEKFNLGQAVMTREVAESGADQNALADILTRHHNGDWGDLCEEDKELNDMAIENDVNRILSKYCIEQGDVYIITDRGRGQAYTTILFTHEY